MTDGRDQFCCTPRLDRTTRYPHLESGNTLATTAEEGSVVLNEIDVGASVRLRAEGGVAIGVEDVGRSCDPGCAPSPRPVVLLAAGEVVGMEDGGGDSESWDSRI